MYENQTLLSGPDTPRNASRHEQNSLMPVDSNEIVCKSDNGCEQKQHMSINALAKVLPG